MILAIYLRYLNLGNKMKTWISLWCERGALGKQLSCLVCWLLLIYVKLQIMSCIYIYIIHKWRRYMDIRTTTFDCRWRIGYGQKATLICLLLFEIYKSYLSRERGVVLLEILFTVWSIVKLFVQQPDSTHI